MAKAKKDISISQEQYEKIMSELNDIKLTLADRNHIDQTVKDNDALLKGNGKMGFVAVRDEVSSWKEDKKYYSRYIGTLVITNLVSLFAYIATWFAKVQPLLNTLEAQGKIILP